MIIVSSRERALIMRFPGNETPQVSVPCQGAFNKILVSIWYPEDSSSGKHDTFASLGVAIVMTSVKFELH